LVRFSHPPCCDLPKICKSSCSSCSYSESILRLEPPALSTCQLRLPGSINDRLLGPCQIASVSEQSDGYGGFKVEERQARFFPSHWTWPYEQTTIFFPFYLACTYRHGFQFPRCITRRSSTFFTAFIDHRISSSPACYFLLRVGNEDQVPPFYAAAIASFFFSSRPISRWTAYVWELLRKTTPCGPRRRGGRVTYDLSRSHGKFLNGPTIIRQTFCSSFPMHRTCCHSEPPSPPV